MIMHEIIFLNIFPKELFILSLIFLCLVVWYFFIACLCFIFSSLLLSGPAPPEMGNIPSFDFAICWIGFNLKFVPCSCRGGHKTFVAPPLFPAFKVLFIEVCINLWLLGGAGSGRLGVGGLHVHLKIVITISFKICRLKSKTRKVLGIPYPVSEMSKILSTNPSLLMMNVLFCISTPLASFMGLLLIVIGREDERGWQRRPSRDHNGGTGREG